MLQRPPPLLNSFVSRLCIKWSAAGCGGCWPRKRQPGPRRGRVLRSPSWKKAGDGFFHRQSVALMWGGPIPAGDRDTGPPRGLVVGREGIRSGIAGVLLWGNPV